MVTHRSSDVSIIKTTHADWMCDNTSMTIIVSVKKIHLHGVYHRSKNKTIHVHEKNKQ